MADICRFTCHSYPSFTTEVEEEFRCRHSFGICVLRAEVEAVFKASHTPIEEEDGGRTCRVQGGLWHQATKCFYYSEENDEKAKREQGFPQQQWRCPASDGCYHCEEPGHIAHYCLAPAPVDLVPQLWLKLGHPWTVDCMWVVHSTLGDAGRWWIWVLQFP